MDRRKIAMLLMLGLGLAFIYHGLQRPQAPIITQESQVISKAATAKQIPSPGVYSSYEVRDAEASRDQTEIARVSAKEPNGFQRRLKMFRKYKHKVLKTEGEVRLLHALVADDATQTMALQALNPTTAEDDRLTVVDYILAGLDEQKNLGRSALRDKVITLLHSELPEGLSKKEIKSLAGDRIELFVALKQVDPRAAELLLAAPKSELNKRIYQYAMLNYGKKGS